MKPTADQLIAEVRAGIAATNSRLQQAIDAEDWDTVAQIRKDALMRPSKERAQQLAAQIFNGGPNHIPTERDLTHAADREARNAAYKAGLARTNEQLVETPEEAIRRLYRAVRSGQTKREIWDQHGQVFCILMTEYEGHRFLNLQTLGRHISLQNSADEAIEQIIKIVASYAPKEEPKCSGRRQPREFYPLRADGAITDAAGKVVVPPMSQLKPNGDGSFSYQPADAAPAMLMRKCPRCHAPEGTYCQPACPRLKAAVAVPIDDRSNALRKRINDAFHRAGFYELLEDNVAVVLPDGDTAWTELPDTTLRPMAPRDLSDPVDPEVLRLVYQTFRPGPSPEGCAALFFKTPEEAADQLVAEMEKYLRGVIHANPHAKDFVRHMRGERGLTHKLFVSWRRQPQLVEAADGTDRWMAIARFVAQWADKKFDPNAKPIHAIDAMNSMLEFERSTDAMMLSLAVTGTASRRIGRDGRAEVINETAMIDYAKQFPWINGLHPLLRSLIDASGAVPGTNAWRDVRKQVISEQKRFRAGPTPEREAQIDREVAQGHAIGTALRIERRLDDNRGGMLTTPMPHMKLGPATT